MVDLQMAGIVQRLGDAGLSIHMTEPARNWLAAKGYDQQYGARPLRRALQRYVENPLSIRLLKGDFQPGDLIVIDEYNNELAFERHLDQESNYMEMPPQYVENENEHLNDWLTSQNA